MMNKPPKRKGNRANKESYEPSQLEVNCFQRCTQDQKLALVRIKKMKLNKKRFVEIEKYFSDQIEKSEENGSVTLSADLINVLCYGLGQGRSNVRKNIGNFYQRQGLMNVTPREHKGMVFNKVQPGANIGRHPKNGRKRANPLLGRVGNQKKKNTFTKSKKGKKQKLRLKIPKIKINLSKAISDKNLNQINGNVNFVQDSKGTPNEEKSALGIYKKLKLTGQRKEKQDQNHKKEATGGKEQNEQNDNNEDQEENDPKNIGKTIKKRLKFKTKFSNYNRKRKYPLVPKNSHKINDLQNQTLCETINNNQFKKKKVNSKYENPIRRRSGRKIQKEKKFKRIEMEMEIQKEERQNQNEIRIEETGVESFIENCSNQVTTRDNAFNINQHKNYCKSKDPNVWVINSFPSKNNKALFDQEFEKNNKKIYAMLILVDFLYKLDKTKYCQTLDELENQAKESNDEELLKYVILKKEKFQLEKDSNVNENRNIQRIANEY
ncbi:hypothetical protein M0812_21867 [Anaeramoeba flamelloides]|uniref:Uncharacterized protein n=1 Tax=Anaeramoeba flamelloides TaxID=1746091 RepID=A0AAV7YVT4_9EUKA|nr:hypothetical protein M0812_21867 [Anaeramoeba flamelloides]